MVHIHHVPGRLRVRIASLRRDPAIAYAVEQRLRQVAGVRSADANPLTGSVVVLYDPAVTAAAALIAAIRGWGYLLEERRPEGLRKRREPRPAGDHLAKKAAEAVVWHVVEKAVERSLPMLIAALL